MKSLSNFLDEAKATYCGRCETTHVPPSKGGTCPAVKEEVNSIDEASDEEKARRLALIKFYAKNKTTKVPEGKAKGVLTKGKNQFGSRHIGKFNKYTGKTGTGTLANTASNKAVIGEEQIDELSKATLGSYTKKAARSTAGLAANAAARAALHGNASEYDKRTLRNRITGISKATDRMTKEEVEELDEVSAAKLRDYSDAASDARGHRNLPTAKLDKRYKSMALAHEKIRARHAQVAATEETAKTLSQFFEEANNNLFEADQIKAHHERVKKLKGKKVSFTHPVSKQKITGTMQKIVQMGGLPYAHVETGKSAHRVPVHQID